MTLYAYRLCVFEWPTDDGEPWNRYYGDGAPDPFDEIPPWLLKLCEAAIREPWSPSVHRSPLSRVSGRVKVSDDGEDTVLGVLMPKVNRRHYLSASGAHELARDMRAFGAVVTVERSAAITEWTEVDSEPAHV